MNVGILHPGEMGACVGSALMKANDCRVMWTSERRSAATQARAEAAGLKDAGFITALCEQVEVIISICPPDAAETVASGVAARKFTGLYIDANAISPDRVKRIAASLERAGARFVDGGIIGPPPTRHGTTRLYLSGSGAEEAAALFAETLLPATIVGDEVGGASALKMCYAAYSKGSTALLAAVLGAADELGVRERLEAQWKSSNPAWLAAAETLPVAARKAWRFVAEMDEIADTFRAAGFPGEFHRAAAEVFARLKEFKHAEDPPPSKLLTALRRPPGRSSE